MNVVTVKNNVFRVSEKATVKVNEVNFDEILSLFFSPKSLENTKLNKKRVIRFA
jgi:hypothetical protein